MDDEANINDKINLNSNIVYDIENYNIIDRLLTINKTAPSLEPLREKARNNHLDYKLH